jgi:hypothetical protein
MARRSAAGPTSKTRKTMGGRVAAPAPATRGGGEKGPHPPERKEGGQAVPKVARARQGPGCGDGDCNAAWPELISRKERRRLESPCKRAQQ